MRNPARDFILPRHPLVHRRRRRQQRPARTAPGDLCTAYWYPLYAYVRRHGLAPEDAKDATQSFFLSILERNSIATADPRRGRLWTFLPGAFGHQLINAHRAASREKRGGGIEFVPLEIAEAETRFAAASGSAEPATQFETEWAGAIQKSLLLCRCGRCGWRVPWRSDVAGSCI